MTSSHKQLVDDMLEAFRRGDIEAVLACVHPDVTISQTHGTSYSGDYHGRDGFLQMLQGLGGPYELNLQHGEVVDGGDKVFNLMTMEFTSKDTGRSATSRIVEVYEFTDGLVYKIDNFYKDADAVAGLLDASASTHKVPTAAGSETGARS